MDAQAKEYSPLRRRVPSAAKPQPKLGISPAKHVLSHIEGAAKVGEENAKLIRKNIYLSPSNLAPLRLGGRSIRIGDVSCIEKFAQAAKHFKHSNAIQTQITKFGWHNAK
jgi:hypothetical protein